MRCIRRGLSEEKSVFHKFFWVRLIRGVRLVTLEVITRSLSPLSPRQTCFSLSLPFLFEHIFTVSASLTLKHSSRVVFLSHVLSLFLNSINFNKFIFLFISNGVHFISSIDSFNHCCPHNQKATIGAVNKDQTTHDFLRLSHRVPHQQLAQST